jgi:hypothetical protein
MKLFSFFTARRNKFISNAPIKLNLGCGEMYIKGWVNIDIDPNVKSDLCCDLLSIKNHFNPGMVAEIMLLHSVSYLRLWEARIFFKDIYTLLIPGGKLILEFPDIAKCAHAIIDNESKIDQYLESVRAYYAFDMDQIKRKDKYQPYAFGWSAWHISHELKNIGFREVLIEEPLTHGPRIWRDSRIEVKK